MKWIAFLCLGLTFTACNVKPEPLQFGKDTCDHCRMTLMDNKFGAEIITQKGKIYKFDDMSCLLAFYHTDKNIRDQIKSVLAADFLTPGHLIPVEEAFFVKSDQVRSPMGGNVAAFLNTTQRDQVNAGWKGSILIWEDLVKEQF